MVCFRSSVTLLLLYADKLNAATSKNQKQLIKKYQERFRAAFPGETLNPDNLQVLVESSTGFLSQEEANKQKRDVENTKPNPKPDYRFDETEEEIPDYDTPLYDENGKRMKLDPALAKSKLETGRDRKRTRHEHQYYREEYGYECYDTVEDQYFRAADEWTTVRNLTDHNGIVAGVTAYYQCHCEGGDTGRYICRPTQVPCYSKYTGKYHTVGSQFPIETERDEYLCYCYGGATGRYECEEREHGCYDEQWNKQKYRINEKFEQVRADGLTYDCECQYGSRVQERVIICRLARYCQIDDDIIMIGDTFDIFAADGTVQHRCECKRGDRHTNKLECKANKSMKKTNKYLQTDGSGPRPDDKNQKKNYEKNPNDYTGNGYNLDDSLDGVEPLSYAELERMAYDTDPNWDLPQDYDPDDMYQDFALSKHENSQS